jgi:pre-mRNA-splicing factor ISY1
MLDRSLEFKNEGRKNPKERHPFLALECHNLIEAEKWRYQIIEEI